MKCKEHFEHIVKWFIKCLIYGSTFRWGEYSKSITIYLCTLYMNFFILLIDLFHYHFMFKLNFYTIFDIWSQNYCYNVGRRRFIFLNLWMYFENLMEIWTIWDPYCSLSWSKKINNYKEWLKKYFYRKSNSIWAQFNIL